MPIILIPPGTRLCGEPGQRPDWLPPVCPRPRLPLQLVHQAGQELARGSCCPPPAAAAILISGGGGEGDKIFCTGRHETSEGKCGLAAIVPDLALHSKGELGGPPGDDG
jgi:hypothetical protein